MSLLQIDSFKDLILIVGIFFTALSVIIGGGLSVWLMFRGKSYIETQRTNAALTERLELIEKENVRLKEQKINLSTEVKSCRATNKNLKTATLNMVKCFGDKDVPVDCDEIESFLEDE